MRLVFICVWVFCLVFPIEVWGKETSQRKNLAQKRAKKRNKNVSSKRIIKRDSTKKNVTKRRKKDRFPPMLLQNGNSGERVSIRLYDERGYSRKEALGKLKDFLRCRRTGRKYRIHWRLVSHLYNVFRHFDGKKMIFYSGVRHPKVCKARESRHITGQALDFRVEGVSNRALRDYVMSRFRKVGVGYYPSSIFVHFDVREKSAFWVDLSRPGQNYRYVENPREYLREEQLGFAKKAEAKAEKEPLEIEPELEQKASESSVATHEQDELGTLELKTSELIAPEIAMPEQKAPNMGSPFPGRVFGKENLLNRFKPSPLPL
ncbi:MAG: DUF882 domain-containing protein [Pseudomonadota bacterium]